MKYLILFLFPFFVFAQGEPKKLDLKWQPKCADTKIEDYMGTYERCLKRGQADDYCKCLAQKSITDLTCEDHKKFKADAKAAVEFGKTTSDECQKTAPKLKK